MKTAPPADADMAARMFDLAAYIRDHADETITLEALGARVGLSPSRLQRRFTDAVGVTPKAYQSAERLKRLKAGLKEGEGVLGAIFDAGYGSTSRVYEALDGGLGMTPSAYRKGGAGETISYAVRETVLGLLLVAATDRGVCKVSVGDEADGLVAELEAEFPRARIVPASPAAKPQIDAWMAALAEHLKAGGPAPDLPVDLRGTAFQVKVWRFLMTIPPGQVMSYAEVAEGIGEPRAVRAVASACARNKVPFLAPCHRVLRSDGTLGGYRFGPERKRALLDSERQAASRGAPGAASAGRR